MHTRPMINPFVEPTKADFDAYIEFLARFNSTQIALGETVQGSGTPYGVQWMLFSLR